MSFRNCCAQLTNCACWCYSQLPACELLLQSHTYCPVVAVRTLILCCCCSPHPKTVQTATIHCYRRKQMIQVIFSVLTVVVRTLILCGLQQQHSKCAVCVCALCHGQWEGGVRQVVWGGGGCSALPAGAVDRKGEGEGVALLACSPHTSRQRTATPACTISQWGTTVSESHQTGFTSRRHTVKIL